MKPSITNTDAVWEWFGKNQPYSAVLVEAKYKNEQLNDEARKDFFSTGKAYVDFVLRTISEHFDTNFTRKRALDFGCGVGRLTIPLSAACQRVVGVDASPSMLEEAKKNADAKGYGRSQRIFMLLVRLKELCAVGGGTKFTVNQSGWNNYD